jgi:excisionase family DNA binding protein
MNRLFTKQAVTEGYHLPRHLYDQLFAEVAAIEKSDQGEPLFLEAHVDAWLTVRYDTPPRHGGSSDDDFLTTREVASLLRCSYSEARDRLLDGRIRAIKDGRWLRTCRTWVQEYITKKTVKPIEEEMVPVPAPRGRRHVNGGIKLKKGGIGWRFLDRLSKD